MNILNNNIDSSKINYKQVRLCLQFLEMEKKM